jgi:aryl-alcohol dehydrogenase-like predicted oxidoreductase
MQHRTLGRQGLAVSAIGYGSMGLTMAFGARYARLPDWI